jgi:putative acetyltransferase
MTTAPTIRDETASDQEAVFRVERAAFGREVEPGLVDELRANGHLTVSLVAEVDGAVVGHVAYSPVRFEPELPGVRAVLLGPLAVAPEHQRRGIGGALLRAGNARCAELGYDAVFLVGHVTYYPQFGFRPGRELGVHYLDDRDSYMGLELRAGALAGVEVQLVASEEFAPYE